MLRQVSDYLFMGSLIFLIVIVLIFLLGNRGMSSYTSAMNASGATTDLQMTHDHKQTLEKQDNRLFRLLKSYLFWIPIASMAVSIVLSKI